MVFVLCHIVGGVLHADMCIKVFMETDFLMGMIWFWSKGKKRLSLEEKVLGDRVHGDGRSSFDYIVMISESMKD